MTVITIITSLFYVTPHYITHKKPVINIGYFCTQDIMLVFVMERKCVYCEAENEVFFTKEQKFSLSKPQRHIGGNSDRVSTLIMVNELTSHQDRFTTRKDSRYQLTRRLGGARGRYGLYGEEIKVSAGTRILSPDRPVRRFGRSHACQRCHDSGG